MKLIESLYVCVCVCVCVCVRVCVLSIPHVPSPVCNSRVDAAGRTLSLSCLREFKRQRQNK